MLKVICNKNRRVTAIATTGLRRWIIEGKLIIGVPNCIHTRFRSSESSSTVRNPFNVQLISDDIFEQVFPNVVKRPKEESDYDVNILRKCHDHLNSHGLTEATMTTEHGRNGDKDEVASPVSFAIPSLEGIDIEDHFHNIALQQTFRYRQLLEQLVDAKLPNQPPVWNFKSGWTKYESDGSFVSVPFPDANALVFDVEVSSDTGGQIPTLACAVSPTHWYSWCSLKLVEQKGNDNNRMPSSVEDSIEKCITLNDLIPLETLPGHVKPLDGQPWTEKIVCGHNVCYDRARIKEQYLCDKSKVRFMDTMALHIAISGITSYQRALKMSMNKNGDKESLQKLSGQQRGAIVHNDYLGWNGCSSLNNLVDVYKLYCNKVISKESRNVFVTGTLEDVRQDFQHLTSYCAKDVQATHEILCKLMPLFNKRFPSPVTLSGMLEMGTTYLPINQNWKTYLKRSEQTYNDMEAQLKSILMQKANDALQFLQNEKYKRDPWLWDLDWKVTKSRKKVGTSSGAVDEDVSSYPAWYKKLLYKKDDPDYVPGPANISTSMQIVPKLLRLCWFGFPLHYSRQTGWGFLIKKPEEEIQRLKCEPSLEELGFDLPPEEEFSFPYEEWEAIFEKSKLRIIKKLEEKGNGAKATNVEMLKNECINKTEDIAQSVNDFIKGLDILADLGIRTKGEPSSKKTKKTSSTDRLHSPHPNCLFRPLPHKDGVNFRVGNPLAKDFLNKIEDGILTTADTTGNIDEEEDIANKVVRISKMLSYWRNNRDRILGQMNVWLKKDELPDALRPDSDCTSSEDFGFGAILPQVSVSGTLTRRAVEATWMTASNAYEDRIGSELKGMIQAPPTRHFVGADVDSQELWIASIIGDADFAGIPGCTALGWMTLQGTKIAGTDMHSKTAARIGIDRDQAKILNYGRIYGAGVNFAERLLMQFNHDMTQEDARAKARDMYKMTKGERKYILNDEGRQMVNSVSEVNSKYAKKENSYSKKDLVNVLNYFHYDTTDYMQLVEKYAWAGGTESYMFNRLEEIAQGECPRTPILDCCISRSLVPAVVQNDFMTSRVNWVVQSSAVDYLHLMLTCMNWLMTKYNIQGRFCLSVHDEVRYLVASEDRYRAAIALQITNLLTRAFCSSRFGIFDLPQSISFFSQVDVDKALRKEVTMDCVTPSNPNGLSNGYDIPKGEALNIYEILKLTNNGSLNK